MPLTFGPENYGYRPDSTFGARFYSDKSEPYHALQSIAGNRLASASGNVLLATTDTDKRSEELAA